MNNDNLFFHCSERNKLSDPRSTYYLIEVENSSQTYKINTIL